MSGQATGQWAARLGAALAGVLLLAGGCFSPSGDQRLARYRPDAKPYRPAPAAAAPARPAPAPTEPAGAGVTSPAPAKPPAAAPTPAPAHSAAREPAPTIKILRSGDAVVISLLGIPEPLTIKDMIDELGQVNLPYIGEVKIAGLATSAAEKLIEKAYIDGEYYRKIAVVVVAEQENYYIHGEIQKPGQYPLARELTLLQALSAAGGFTPFAKRAKIEIRRGTARFVYDADEIASGRAPDPRMEAGDIIFVDRRIM